VNLISAGKWNIGNVSVNTDHPIPPEDVFYFEIEILELSEETE
jgi:hypothetical protein